MFDLEILTKLGDYHKKLFSLLENNLDTFESNKTIYEFIENYIKINNLNLAFPIGISINHVIAHDSFHPLHLILLNKGDFVKIDVGFIENSNIIDSARTFEYKKDKLSEGNKENKCINDCKEIANKVEDYIRNQIESSGSVSIQKISSYSNALIVSKGYLGLDYLGGHSIEYGKVHGRKLILNKPLSLLPIQATQFINCDETLGQDEMFAIEIYIGDHIAIGTMVKSTKIPPTHYQINEDIESEKILDLKEKNIFNKIKEFTHGLAYHHNVNTQFDTNIISKLIKKNLIYVHEALEYTNPKVKFVQYEDCFIIKQNKLINLSKITSI